MSAQRVDRGTESRSLQRREEKRRSLKSHRRRNALIGLSAVAVTVVTVLAVGMDRLLRPGAFPVEELRIQGEFVHLVPEAVEMAVLDELGDNYFSQDLSRIERAVEALDWVRQARVHRSWPSGLGVRIEEHRPVAQWKDSLWLNEQGEIFSLDLAAGPEGLVGFHGPDQAARDILERYQGWLPDLVSVGLMPVEVKVDDRFSWTLYLAVEEGHAPIEVNIGSGHHEVRLKRLIESFDLLRESTSSIASMDLRYPNGIAVTEGQLQSDLDNDLALNEVDQ